MTSTIPSTATALDTDTWSTSLYGPGGTAEVSGGLLTLTGLSGGSQGFIEMWGAPTIGTGTLLEAYARHPDAGLNAGDNASYPDETNTAGEVGYKGSDWSNVIRMMDYPDLEKYSMQASAGGTNSGYVDTAVDFDAAWHAYHIYRSDAGTAEFQIDDNAYEVLGPPYVPTIGIRPWLMSYARTPAPQSRFEVDWIRVRQYCGAEATAIVGAEEGLSTFYRDADGDGYGDPNDWILAESAPFGLHGGQHRLRRRRRRVNPGATEVCNGVDDDCDGMVDADDPADR